MRLRIPVLLALLLLLTAGSAAAQVRFAGTVVDDDSEQPIAGARVEILDFDGLRLAQLSTDSAGNFEYRLRRPGSYRLRVGRIGYQSVFIRELWTGAHAYLNVEVRLKSDAVLLTPLTIVARTELATSPVLDGFYARLRSGLGTYYTRADVQRLAPVHLSELAARVPGMYVTTSGMGPRRQIYTGRSAAAVRDCPVQIWVDGFLLNPRGPGGAVIGETLDEAVAPMNVEGIEIYRSMATVPAEFLNPDARCGVIAVWTRRGGPR